MKFISLWQPWATLMVLRVKQNETRGWYTGHRGDFGIHAAKKWSRELSAMCLTEPFRGVLQPLLDATGATDVRDVLPFGKLVAVTHLDRCVKITPQNAPPKGSLERAFGDYEPGRCMWQTSNLRPIEMIDWSGAQGFFEVPNEVVRFLDGKAEITMPFTNPNLFTMEKQ